MYPKEYLGGQCFIESGPRSCHSLIAAAVLNFPNDQLSHSPGSNKVQIMEQDMGK